MVDLICLMPTYNKEQTVAKAIESVLMQRTNYSYKLIVLDDCSTDSSYQIAKNYQEKYHSKIDIVRSATNQGLLKTITKGYTLLIGTDYFSVLDADDWYTYDRKFDEAINYLESHKDFSMYMTNVNVCRNSESFSNVNIPDSVRDFSLQDYYTNSGKGIFVQTSGVIYRNVYFKDRPNEKFIQATQTQYGEYLRADGFRHMWYLHSGKAHFVNRLESVYNWNNDGMYTSLTEDKRNLVNIKLNLACYYFFDNEQYYLNIVHEELCNYFKRNTPISSEYVEIYKVFLKIIYKTGCYDKYGYPKNIIFFMPSREISWYQNCMFELARYVSKNLNIDVYYVDYKDGFISKKLECTNIKLIKYKNGKRNHIPDNSIVFMPITLALHDYFCGGKNIKFLFWCVYPEASVWLKDRLKKNESLLKRFLNCVFLHNSINSIDHVCQDCINKNIGIHEEASYLPIWVEEPEINLNNIVKTKNITEINIAWLGRIESDKIYSIVNLLNNYEKYETTKTKIIHIIGCGSSEKLIDINRYKSIKIKMVGKICGLELDKYLLEHVDILFGIGSSLLEATKIKIPSVLVKMSTVPFFDNRYIYLFNSQKYILGIEDYSYMDQSKIISIDEILDQISTESAYTIVSEKCHNYFIGNHSISSAFCRFMNNLSSSNLIIEEYDTFMNDGFLKKCFKKLLCSRKSRLSK